MRKITQEEFNKSCDLHEKWLKCDGTGEKMNYKGCDLSGLDMSYADMSGADMSRADMRDANMRGADMSDADMDYSMINLSCKDLGIHLDDRLLIQRLYHLLYNAKYSKNTSDRLKKILLTHELKVLANEFHRAKECGEI